MLIDISELLSVDGKDIEVSAYIEMQRFISRICDYEIIRKEPLLIRLHSTGRRRFSLETQVDITLLMQCGRCLDNVENNLCFNVEKEIDMNESDEEKDKLFYISDDKLDVEKLIYNEILVNLPMKVLCSENCKGICNRCGANLNSQTCNCDTTELDPRMSKIRDIFNNFKEV